jgi:hypothetical protein
MSGIVEGFFDPEGGESNGASKNCAFWLAYSNGTCRRAWLARISALPSGLFLFTKLYLGQQPMLDPRATIR